MLATASGDGNYGRPSTVEVRKVPNGKIIKSLKFNSAISIVFSSDNKMVAAVNRAGDVNIWQLDDGHLIHSFEKTLRYASQERLPLVLMENGWLLSVAIKFVCGRCRSISSCLNL